MIVTRNGRTYSLTQCRHRHQPCLSGLSVIEHLADSARSTEGLMGPDFEMQGCVRLTGCSRPCTALFRLTTGGLQLFCDLEPGDWSPGLVRLAEMLEGGGSFAGALPAEPAAMVLASAPARPSRTGLQPEAALH
ncbi:hypothetical protein LV780_01755 [Cereibacter azotoformans]|uniref:DUF1636 domain-containing protein n=1 Tax=Cereibacter azotoformans TaxID=43057 RepID=A0A2T5KF25_9RHOB|nr:hypothetical protein [Cereibacter azotoformans]AXQ92652.1 hypothetical protein D0Z66_01760 [Cereibacter sphaeroides]MBO4169763.1 hypothetical protein [Cereibacter azotoformans]PTR20977.1 hypothetical protein C8J28_101298 [Cereibacter azotoformans]UIJ30931.1 hypothetical protein LV780_01755 [Cereibacter azotoformans]